MKNGETLVKCPSCGALVSTEDLECEICDVCKTNPGK